MGTIETFEDIRSWKAARDLVKCVYRATSEGDFARDFALRDQVRRAAISILANVAEGFERRGDREFARFLVIAKASAGEVRALLYVAHDVGLLSTTEYELLHTKSVETSQMIAGFIRYLRSRNVTRS